MLELLAGYSKQRTTLVEVIYQATPVWFPMGLTAIPLSYPIGQKAARAEHQGGKKNCMLLVASGDDFKTC